MAPKRLIRCF